MIILLSNLDRWQHAADTTGRLNTRKAKKTCFSVSMIFSKKFLNLNNKILRQKYHGSFRVLSLSFCGKVWSTAFWMYATQINCLYFIPESTSSNHVMAVLDLEPNDKIMSGL